MGRGAGPAHRRRLRAVLNDVPTPADGALRRRNRVDPFGNIIASGFRGAFMGNRGVLHDDTGTIVRRQATRSWITCRLEFKGRRRRLLQPGRWTELFFWDEVTALAAGHRPCFECRRQDAVRFRDLFREVTGDATAGAAAIDRRLATERGALGSPPRVGVAVVTAVTARLPEHAMVLHDGLPHVLTQGQLRPWNETGYGAATALPTGQVPVITPATTVAILAAGYPPLMV